MPQIQKTKKKPKTKKVQKTLRKNIIQMSAFLQNRKKPEIVILAFCVMTFEPIKIKTH